ncbi:MAG TPA: two-component sensor histidine kinase, partial [Fibrella sp.]
FNKRPLTGIGLFLVGTLLTFGLCTVFVSDPPEPLYLLNSLYFIVLYISRLPRFIYPFCYRTSLYFFFGSFICASTAAVVVYRQQIREDLLTKRDIGTSLLAENDEFGEYLLHKAQSSVYSDLGIQQIFQADTLPLRRERIQTRIKRLHLDKYFDKYDTEVSSFDVNGISLDASTDAASLSAYVSKFQRGRNKTKYGNLYFINEIGNQFIKEYVDFISIRTADSTVVGYVVLDLKLRKEAPSSVYPELLIQDKLVQSPKIRQYSHAVYEQAAGSPFPTLAQSTGTYNYELKLPNTVLADPVLYETGITIGGFRHLGLRGTNGRTLVVSSPGYLFGSVSANFSFLYLILVLTVIVIIGLYAVQYGFSRFTTNYSTRIQILLNLTFFIPLLLVVLIILSVTRSNYINNQEASHLSTTKNIASKFQVYLSEHLRGIRSKEAMEQELETIARDASIDINLFNTAGLVYMTTRKLMYETGHMSPYINPLAYMYIVEDKESQILINESLGTKQFTTAYVGIKSAGGQLIGILSIPYFYSRPELDRQ